MTNIQVRKAHYLSVINYIVHCCAWPGVSQNFSLILNNLHVNYDDELASIISHKTRNRYDLRGGYREVTKYFHLIALKLEMRQTNKQTIMQEGVM